MKKVSFISIVAAALLVAGCGKEGGRATIKATIHSHASDSKVFVDDSHFSCWQEGDAVKVNGADGAIGTVSANARRGTIDLVEEPTRPAYAVYPASAVTSAAVAAEGTTVHLPSVQQCVVRDGRQVVEALMASQGTDQLDFYNLCALVKVVVPATLEVTNIKVTTFTTDGAGTIQPSGIRMWGHGTVAFNGDGQRPVLSPLTRSNVGAGGVLDGGDTVTLHIVDRTSDGVYYVAVPAVENINFDVAVGYKVTDAQNVNHYYYSIKKQSGNNNCLYANQIGPVYFTDIVEPTPNDFDPNDFLPGIFTVSDTMRVNFGRGNLVFDVTTSGNDGHGYTWSFNTTQYTCMGYSVRLQGNTPTSGVSEYCKTSVNAGVFPNNNGGYSNATYYEYGEYLDGDLWYTLSLAEWQYILHTRATTYGRFAKGQVDGNNGLLIFPDDFVWPNASIPQPTVLNDGASGFTAFSYTVAQWDDLEAAGCVFLRSCGYRTHNNAAALNQGTNGFYWTRDFNGTSQTYSYLCFTDTEINPTSTSTTASLQLHAGYALSVRLVRRIL